MNDRLRGLWDFDDLDTSEKRLGEQLDRETTDPGRAEVLTQLARVEGLRDRFDAGDKLIDEAAVLAGDDKTAHARIDLERGRLRRSSGDPDAALPLFESAFDIANDAGQTFIAADAAHMAALVAGGRDGFIVWTRRGIDIAEADEGARHWLGPLYNNLGWEYFEAADYEEALDAFERQLVAREQQNDPRQMIEIARYAIGKALRALGRSKEAVPMLETAVAWAEGERSPDGWFHEELAEEYAAVGRDEDAAVQARAAIPLLERDDPDFANDEQRAARLRALAAAGTSEPSS
jgi:tetratricopeptide (TPR) repeat protein